MPTMAREKNIICDLDGTIALDDGRAQKYLWPKETRDWLGYIAACEEDLPNWCVIDLMRLYWEDGYGIHILSNRDASSQEPTKRWLAKNAVPYSSLHLRPSSEDWSSTQIKLTWSQQLGLTPENTAFVLEDRQAMVDAWRRANFTCFQVASRNF